MKLRYPKVTHHRGLRLALTDPIIGWPSRLVPEPFDLQRQLLKFFAVRWE